MIGPNQLLFRGYRRADFESMWKLDQACFPSGIAYSKSELRAFLSAKTAETIVVERDGRIVAFVIGWRRGRTEGHVITLDVTTAARRQGLGRRLMTALEARFRAAGITRMRLETAVTNTVAVSFYEALGYRRAARLRSYYGPRLDAWSMQKELDSPPTHPAGDPARTARPSSAAWQYGSRGKC
jgi:ribosomal-protein-alanine N-acetyltransferase